MIINEEVEIDLSGLQIEEYKQVKIRKMVSCYYQVLFIAASLKIHVLEISSTKN